MPSRSMQPSARTRDAVAILALLALVFAPFRDLVSGFPFTEKSDVIDLVVPHAAMLVRGVERGVFPLWNPTLGGGLPYMATIPLMLPFYPGAALFFLASMGHALSWGFLLHALLGPVLLYAAVRAMGARPLAAFTAGAAWGLANANVAYVNEGYLQEAVIMAYAAAPWLVLETALRRPDRWLRTGLLGGALLGLMLAGGCPIEGQLISYAFALYVAVRLATLPDWSARGRAVGVCFAMYGAGFALAAIHWAPMMEAMGLAYHPPAGVEENGYVRPWQLAGWFLPFAERAELPMYLHAYVPMAALALALAAVGRRMRPQAFGLWVVAFFAEVAAMGPETPLYPAMVRALPLFNTVYYPHVFEAVVMVALAMLAGLGAEAILEEPRAAARRLLFAGLGLAILAAFAKAAPTRYIASPRDAMQVFPALAATLAVGYLGAQGKLGGPRLAAALAILVSIDGLTYASAARSEVPRPLDLAAYFEGGPGTPTGVLRESTGRVVAEGYKWGAVAGDRGVKISQPTYVGFEDVRSAFKFPHPRFRELLRAAAPWNLEDPDLLFDEVEEDPPALNEGEARVRILDLLGVRTLMTTSREVAGDAFVPEASGRGFRVYARATPPPRAYLASVAQKVGTGDESLGLLRGSTAPFTEVAVFEGPGEALGRAGETPPGPVGTAETLERDLNRLLFAVSAEREALLVVDTAYYPGWKAFVDGVERPIVLANHALQGVFVGPGEHAVEFRYDPACFRLGLLVSLSAAAVLGLALMQPALRRKLAGR